MRKHSTPWSWIPTLYVAEGLPYFAVNTLTVLMLTNIGLSKAEMAFYTGWLYLPWVIKPFWSPFVDLIGTKRVWVSSMQAILCVAMAAVAGITIAAVPLMLPASLWLIATLVSFWIMAFASATHDIAADGFYILALDEWQQAAYVGVRSTFYRIASVVGQGGLVMLAGYLESTTGNIPLSWGITFAILSLFFLLIFGYHLLVLPRPDSDKPATDVKASGIIVDFLHTFVTFFRRPFIWSALAFMLLYRLPEALCIKLVQPFLKDSPAAGGLGLSTTQIGVVNGTVGVIALLAGGIAGGVAISRIGLRRCLWPMAAALALPCVVYCYLAAMQPADFLLVSTLIGIEQFGYGYGFTAFMLFLMYYSRGESSTSHYAFCTAFMALGMMLPGMVAGWIFERLAALGDMARQYDIFTILLPADGSDMGYPLFFLFVMLTTLATFGVTAIIWRKLPELTAKA